VGTANAGGAAAEARAPSTVPRPANVGGSSSLSAEGRAGYPHTWTDAEVRAHTDGDMELLFKLQVRPVHFSLG